MRRSRPFLVALAISFALHLLAISGPGWNLPTLDELLAPDDEPPLEARLMAQPGPPAVQAKRPSPKRVPASVPTPAPPTEIARVSPGGTPPAAPVEPDTVVEDSLAAAPPAPELPALAMTLPPYVRITYRVTLGEAGFLVGSAVQELRQDGSRYTMRSSAETVGIVWLFKPARMVNVSKGDVVASGLRPREFSVERNNGKNDTATLDWAAGEVRLDSGRQYPLKPGTQDMLSMFAQLAMLPLAGPLISIPVVTGKRVEQYEFAVVGRETIATPRGERATVHLSNRQPGSRESTDVWLGLDDGHLPVRIRHVDRRGDIFDQTAERIDFEEGQR